MTTIERILDLMQKRDLTATVLSRETGIPTSNISDWKKGKSRPSADAVARIADYFGVSADYLLCRTDSPVPAEEIFALSTGGELSDLPPEALQEIENFRQYVIQKYKKK